MKRRVLISNQDGEMFHFCEKVLQGKYSTSSLSKEMKLTEYLEGNTIDLCILTISKALSCSLKFYDIIRNFTQASVIPIIFVTDQKDLELENEALSLGAEDYITLPISPQLLLHRVTNTLELHDLRKERPYVETYQDAISTSFAELVECRDVDTGGHLKNTTRYFEILLQEAMQSDLYKDIILEEDARDLIRSANLHDIGKLGITDDILHKESSLDYHEFEHMKTHTTLGKQTFEKIIKETGGTRWLYLAKDMAYCHHERWDGKGYPNGLKGEEIPLYARMLTLADVYDALTSERSYKEAYSHEKTTQIILEGKGGYFDPSLVDLYMKANIRFKEQLLKKTEAL